MKEKAARANEKVSNKGHQKNSIMALLDAAPDASVSEIDEEKVGQCVDNLRQVWSGVIVLHPINQPCLGACEGTEQPTSSHQLIVDVMGAQYPS
jgi:hypothetical protein